MLFRSARADRMESQLQTLAETKRQLAGLRRALGSLPHWIALLGHLESEVRRADGLWLERMQLIPSEREGRAAAETPMRLAISGCLVEEVDAQEQAEPGIPRRLKMLLDGLAGSPLVARIEEERIGGPCCSSPPRSMVCCARVRPLRSGAARGDAGDPARRFCGDRKPGSSGNSFAPAGSSQ